MRAYATPHPSGWWIIAGDDWHTSIHADDMGDFIAACKNSGVDLTVRLLGHGLHDEPAPARSEWEPRIPWRVQGWLSALGLVALTLLAAFIQ